MFGNAPSPGSFRAPPLTLLIAAAALGPMAIHAVVPSLPALERAFTTDASTVQFAVSLYLLGIGLGQVIVGPLADHFGRRAVLLAGLATFACASALASLTTDIASFVALRVAQGLSGCVGIVVARAIIRDLFDESRAASKLGGIAMGVSLAPMLSPAVGGLAQGLAGWRGVFWLLAICGGLTLAAASFVVRETRASTGRAPEWKTLASGFRQVLNEPDFLLFTACVGLNTGYFYSFVVGGPFIAQRLLGFTPVEYGTWFAAIALGYAGGNYVSSLVVTRVGIRAMMIGGSALVVPFTCLTPALFAWGEPSAAGLFLPMAGGTFASGLLMPSAIAGAMRVRPDVAGAASGLMGSLQFLFAGTFATAAGFIIERSANPVAVYALMIGTTALGVAAALVAVRQRRTH